MSTNRNSFLLHFGLMFGSILFLTNCSVQKRVHLKGWNVEWKAINPKTQNSEIIQTTKNDITVSKENNRLLQSKNDTAESHIFKKEINIEELDEIKSSVQNKKISPVTIIEKSSKNQSINYKGTNPPNSRVSLPLIFIDIMLLLLGALLLIACLLAAPEALAVGLASGGIFGVIGIVFGIIVGAFLFVLGLILLIIHLSKRQQQKKKVEEVIEEEKRKEAEIETKSSEPEGNSETAPEEIKTTKSSSDALWIIGVAAALVALFFIVK